MALVIIAAICIGSNFLVQKLYQKRYCTSFKAVTFFPVMMALLSTIVYFALNGFKIEVAPFSLLMAGLLAITGAHNNLVGLVIMRHCNMSVYSMFLMMGGMFMPFWYGVLLSPVAEPFTLFKGIGLVLLIVALLLISINKGGKKSSAIGLILCCCVFIMNGFQSTLSKIHQTYATLGTPAVDTEAFIMWNSLFTCLFSSIIFAGASIKERQRQKQMVALGEMVLDANKPTRQKFGLSQMLQILLIVIVVALNCTSGICNTTAQLTVPASVCFPIITGGAIIIMSLGGVIFYKEKINVKGIIGIGIALVSVILFSL